MTDQYRVPLPNGRTAPMPVPTISDPGGEIRHPNGPDNAVSPRPNAPAATPAWPYGPETKPAPVIDRRPVPASRGGE